MKFLSRALFAAILVCSFAVNAQTLKFGHINSNDLLQMMPEVKTADSSLKTYQKSLEDLNQSMVAEYQTKLKDYQDKAPTLTPAVKEVKEQELTDLQNRIQAFQGSAQDKLADKKQELYTPILKKAEDAIKAVGKEKGYSYIFDTGAGAVLYSPEGDNIMPLVKAKLGITADATPPAPKPTGTKTGK
jgi:outer membrane protein